MVPSPPSSTLFPYTTLFRSLQAMQIEKFADIMAYFNHFIKDYAQQFEKLAPIVDRKSTRLNSSHVASSYAVFCLKKKNDRIVENSRARSHEDLIVRRC